MTQYTWSVLSFFLGLILGHWLALGRDKRKEFNELSAPLRSWVVRQIARPEDFLQRPLPTTSEIDALARRLSRRRRKRLVATWIEMSEAYRSNLTRDPLGGESFRRSDPGLDALRRLEKMLRPR